MPFIDHVLFNRLPSFVSTIQVTSLAYRAFLQPSSDKNIRWIHLFEPSLTELGFIQRHRRRECIWKVRLNVKDRIEMLSGGNQLKRGKWGKRGKRASFTNQNGSERSIDSLLASVIFSWFSFISVSSVWSEEFLRWQRRQLQGVLPLFHLAFFFLLKWKKANRGVDFPRLEYIEQTYLEQFIYFEKINDPKTTEKREGWIHGDPTTFWKKFFWSMPQCGNDGSSMKNNFARKKICKFYVE